MKNVEVIIPLLNEYESFGELTKRLKVVKDSLINEEVELKVTFVNDGSDNDFKLIVNNFCKENIGFNCINLTRNFGHQNALRAGVESSNSDAAIFIDGDLQDPPELIIDLIKYWQNGYHHVVCVRKSRKKESLVKKLTAKYYYIIFKKFANFEVTKNAGDFRLIDKWIIDEIKGINEYDLYLRGFIDSLGAKFKKIYYTRDPRFGGKAKYNYSQSIKLALNGLFSLTDIFSKILNWLLFVSLFISFVLVTYIFTSVLFFDNSLVRGWASIMMVLMLVLITQIFTFIYISFNLRKINNQTSNKKNYQIEK